VLISEDSRLAPLSGCMTKWEYMVVEFWCINESIHSVRINGEDAAKEENEGWKSSRHKMLNEVGNEGWELIKIRGVNTYRYEDGYEYFTFKRPL